MKCAARKGQTTIVRFLFGKGADLKANPGITGKSPLIRAISNRHHATVQARVELSADVNKKNRNGRTALDIAVLGAIYPSPKAVGTAQYLRDCGARFSQPKNNAALKLVDSDVRASYDSFDWPGKQN